MPSNHLVVAVVLAGSFTAAAAEQIRGRVVDKGSGAPVEGATVHVTGADGSEHTAVSDARGEYVVEVAPGRYRVTFLGGAKLVSGQVAVEPGVDTRLDGRVEPAGAEVINLESLKAPAVKPQPIDSFAPFRAPPYSDKAIMQDAWVRAWLLLDVDEHGTVTRLKLLKRPGYDLDDIAVSEGFRLRFTPGRDDNDRPVRTMVLWPVEWVANSWLVQYGPGTRTRQPERYGVAGRSSAAYVPCRGDGGWKMGAMYKGYRDCSRPDLSRAQDEAWILPSE